MLSLRRIAILLGVIAILGCKQLDKTVPAETKKQFTPEPALEVGSIKDRDVIVVVVDGLRGDMLPRSKERAPFMNELAAQGLYFRKATSNSSHIMQSLSSFFTGRLPVRGGAIGVFEAEPQEQSKTIAQAFQGAGYYTGLLANHPAIQGAGFTKGFQEVQIAQAGQPLDDSALVKRAGEFLEDAGDDRVFLYVHFAGVLASKLYHPDTSANPETAPYNMRDFGKDYKYSSSELRQSPRGQASIAEYSAAMTAADAAVKGLVDVLKAANRLDNAVVVLTSLHGFELFENGYLGPGWSLMEDSVRVPLIIRAPGAVPAAQTDGSASLVDVAPSLLTLAGLTFDSAPLDGQSLFAANGEKFSYTATDRPRIAELVIPERCIVHSVATSEWKYIISSSYADPNERHALVEAHRETANAIASGSKQMASMWGKEDRSILVKFPGEVPSTLKVYPEVVTKMAAVLAEYQKRCEESGLPLRTPTVTAKAPDADQIENLESLGYL